MVTPSAAAVAVKASSAAAAAAVPTAAAVVQNVTDFASGGALISSPDAGDGAGGLLALLPVPIGRRRLTPRGMAVLYMTLAMSMHFFGYEFARSSNLSLFTSTKTGFASPTAFPLAMACVSPFSVLLLWAYGKDMERTNQPKLALRHCNIVCAFVLFLTGFAVAAITRRGRKVATAAAGVASSDPSLFVSFWNELTWSRIFVWFSFVFQNSYSHLLYTQQWSFLGSIVNSTQGATYFASIAGICSISSTLAGAAVANVVQHVGLAGLLAAAAASVIASLFFAEAAYRMSEKHGFDPTIEIKNKRAQRIQRKLALADNKGSADSADSLLVNEDMSLMAKARELFRRVPVLGALFWEVLAFQSLSTLLNVSFVRKLGEAVTDDSKRAAWTGEFFALVNAVSGVMQFAILPLFMKRVESRWVWRIMPCIPLGCALFQFFQESPSLSLVAGSFFAAKVMDYSLRNVASEMVYVPLDFDSRYLGKEIIGVFGNRFGKSGMSLLLSGISFLFQDFGMVDLSRMTSFMAALWYLAASRLGSLIPRRAEVEETTRRSVGGMPKTKVDSPAPKYQLKDEETGPLLNRQVEGASPKRTLRATNFDSADERLVVADKPPEKLVAAPVAAIPPPPSSAEATGGINARRIVFLPLALVSVALGDYYVRKDFSSPPKISSSSDTEDEDDDDDFEMSSVVADAICRRRTNQSQNETWAQLAEDSDSSRNWLPGDSAGTGSGCDFAGVEVTENQ